LLGRDLVATVHRLEVDLDNLRAAIDWGIESKSFNLAADLLEALALFFYVLGLRSEGWALCERLIAEEELDPFRRAAMLLWAGELCLVHNS
jgi:hypothetical protein